MASCLCAVRIHECVVRAEDRRLCVARQTHSCTMSKNGGTGAHAGLIMWSLSFDTVSLEYMRSIGRLRATPMLYVEVNKASFSGCDLDRTCIVICVFCARVGGIELLCPSFDVASLANRASVPCQVRKSTMHRARR